MKKMSRLWASIFAGIVTLVLIGTMLFVHDTVFSGDIGVGEKGVWSWFHCFVGFLNVIGILGMLVIMIADWALWGDDDNGPLCFLYGDYDDSKDEDDKSTGGVSMTKFFVWAGVIVLGIWLYTIVSDSTKQCVKLYNTSKIYSNQYTQKVQEKEGFYDKLWKTYLTKEKITNVNKETFLQVSKVIMENRKDGPNLTWKWVHENQNIPFEEFTKFYADLSNFITQQRESYFNIEKECQAIANKNNTMLDTFPNNVYNRIVKCKQINFEYGFLSDSTRNVFKSKNENLK